MVELHSLISSTTRLKVSSVLNKDNAQFGKQHLIDGQDETCWNSEPATPGASQFIIVDFDQPVTIHKIVFTFQGGFVGKNCKALGSKAESPNDYNNDLGEIYPEDINLEQTFAIEPKPGMKRLKIIFDASTDFFGRITIYKMDILGVDAE